MTEKPQEQSEDRWENEGGASNPEPREKTPKAREIPLPTRNSIFAAFRRIAKPKKG
jgi:hypothetical protein